ncbi:MAG: hypothetical protein B0W54_01570 [Cellvibrio sp. 79]|nr:MAG: hypothetical protein B0W54_01570 [Cellvibrio sp. 79]
MGAWGTGIFEDDASLDLLADAIESDAESFIRNSSSHFNEEYLEYDQCQEVIVSGVILDALLNKTTYRSSDKEFQEWIANQEIKELANLKESILKGLKVVISEKSELNELWQENEEEYYSWRKNIETLTANLGG